jgi:uncharacterized CHY-type Zn-finger protein
MIFITTNYYFDDEEYEYENNICFICFENELESKFLLTKLKNQHFYIKICLCDGWIHSECLTCWYNMKQTCPICRKHMIELIKQHDDTYLNKITLFFDYNYNIFNNDNNNITIQITKIVGFLLFFTYFIYFFYYYTFFYLLFFVLYFLFSGFYFLLFIIYSYNYHCRQVL